LAITTTSGPGLALKTEAAGLAVITELPLVIVDVQRGGPSTGLPTKTEQADLFQALFGRNGESPMPVIAAFGPSDAFYTAIEASRIALEHMTPIIMLTDSYTANGSQPFRIPDLNEIPEIKPPIVTEPPYQPYERIDKEKMIRGWAKVGVPGLQHRLGSLEKMAVTGTVSYVPENHERMVKERQQKVDAIANDIPLQKVEGNPDAELLIIGWGSTYGHIRRAVNQLRREGIEVAYTQFKYINPLPKNTEEVINKYKKTVVVELNMGQFANYLRMKFPGFNPMQYNKVQGLPFTVQEIVDQIKSLLKK
jgi:2-oxoglutarate ferredoxin oxidoreductase subunit alpha